MESKPLAVEIDEAIAQGRRDATLIEWVYRESLFSDEKDEKDPQASIVHAAFELQKSGWIWTGSQLERDGWYVWFRSQGREARPIAQWGKIA